MLTFLLIYELTGIMLKIDLKLGLFYSMLEYPSSKRMVAFFIPGLPFFCRSKKSSLVHAREKIRENCSFCAIKGL